MLAKKTFHKSPFQSSVCVSAMTITTVIVLLLVVMRR